MRRLDEYEFLSSSDSSLALRRHLSALAARAASLRVSHADHEPRSKSTSQSLQPYSMYEPENPLFHSRFRKRPTLHCQACRTSRSQGLATLSAAFSSPILGGLFQPPTLLGFTLRSFSPVRRSGPDFSSPIRSHAFPQDLLGQVPAHQRFKPVDQRRPFHATPAF